MSRVKERSAASGRNELRHSVITFVSAVVVRIAGKDDWNFNAGAMVDRYPGNVIDDQKRTVALTKRVQPSRFRTTKYDVRIFRHALRYVNEIVLLRLIDIVVELRVHSPNPPCRRYLQREVTPPLMAPPAAEMQMLLPAEKREKLDETVVPIVIPGDRVDRWAS